MSRSIFSMIQKLTSNVRSCNMAQTAFLQKVALEERCILVDEFDRPIAFSVFLFNKDNDLLLQKRSPWKVTFPGYYTNSCCSHPLAEIPGETLEDDAIGIRRAAQRRLNYELGIPLSEIQLSDFFYLSRIHYFSSGDGIWGEHEIDYILFLQKDHITIDPNPDEVSEVQWVSKSMINDLTRTIKAPLTPWFQLILQYKLQLWWDNLKTLDKVQNYSYIIMDKNILLLLSSLCFNWEYCNTIQIKYFIYIILQKKKLSLISLRSLILIKNYMSSRVLPKIKQTLMIYDNGSSNYLIILSKDLELDHQLS
ncbi:isopentenyl-diphosphate Delta-isomerase 1 [Vespula maculifrons]|uniref:isopentenyl-diphosphate Delta-isomerase n=1 Tax=Vespula maculifrons TaxID=7453 RepID=A0ABD2CEP0_VESMC